MMRAANKNRCMLGLKQISQRNRLFSSAGLLPMNLEYPGIPKLISSTDRPIPQLRTTTLSNGLRVYSEDHYGQVSSIGVFLDVGSTFESAENHGISNFLQRMAWKATLNRSHTQFVSEIEKHGAALDTSCGREEMRYQAEVLRGEVELAVDWLGDNLVNPIFTEEDIEDTKKTMLIEEDERFAHPVSLITEGIHAAAFGPESSWGRSQYSDSKTHETIKRQDLVDFCNRFVTPNRIVVAGYQVEHERLVAACDKAFGALAATSAPVIQRPKAVYKGGQVRMHVPENQRHPLEIMAVPEIMTHVSIAFQGAGWEHPDMVPTVLLQSLLGGGSSFSTGGPGKGMYTKLYREVLNKCDWIDSINASANMYKDFGLVGITGSSKPVNSDWLVKVMLQQLLSISQKPISPVALNRAKKQLKSLVFMNLESRSIYCEDIGKQVLVSGVRKTAQEYDADIDKVTAADLKRVVDNLVKSNVSIASFGDVTKVPDVSTVQQWVDALRGASTTTRQTTAV